MVRCLNLNCLLEIVNQLIIENDFPLQVAPLEFLTTFENIVKAREII